MFLMSSLRDAHESRSDEKFIKCLFTLLVSGDLWEGCHLCYIWQWPGVIAQKHIKTSVQAFRTAVTQFSPHSGAAFFVACKEKKIAAKWLEDYSLFKKSIHPSILCMTKSYVFSYYPVHRPKYEQYSKSSHLLWNRNRPTASDILYYTWHWAWIAFPDFHVFHVIPPWSVCCQNQG